MIHFGGDACRDLDEAVTREWLETNGLGGYSSSTIVGLNTRRYHGLLVAATKPPVGRLVMLSKLEETLIVDGRRYELSSNQYPGVIHPQGHKYQTSFRLDPFPIFTYEVEGISIEKSLFMVHGENTTVVQYELKVPVSKFQERGHDGLIPHPSSLILLELRPLVAFRDYHSLAHENAALNRHVQVEDALAIFQPDADLPALHLAHDAGEVDSQSFWYRNFEYQRERERGFDFTEDLFSPLVLKFDLAGRTRFSIIASTERREADRADDYRRREIERRRSVNDRSPQENEFVTALVRAAAQFIVARGQERTVIAGYHWFSDWGRDAMIALPGLTLTTRSFEEARSILSVFARYVDRGMLPNRFPDAGERPEYNTVDATLWYFEAVRAYLNDTNDEEFVREHLYTVLTDIINWHVRGTRYNIHVDAQGLLSSGEEGAQLTWMDAKVGDLVVTPRRGLAVEIQALWYNALRIMEALAGKFGDRVNREQYAMMALRARAAFNQFFWNEAAGCLYDVIDEGSRDASIRPNQIFAVSLHHTMLSEEKAKGVVRVVERKLLTPYGLRSLAPDDAQYRGRCEGDSSSRDLAYHQGTVWAWLLGPFIKAYVKVNGGSEESRQRAARWLMSFQKHLSEAGLGQVSEIFDGDEPHAPRGCIAQAWSVAEILRAAVEDVYVSQPEASAAS